jgi:transposase InsO family protein
MNDKTEEILCHRWAELRFSVVGRLLSCPPERGMLGKELENLSQKEWVHPRTGEPVRFGFSTIEGWYYRAKESANPIAALTTQVRLDEGRSKKISSALSEAVRRQYELHPGWSYTLHHKNLVVVVEEAPFKYGSMPSYATLLRWMKSQGMVRKRRPRKPKPGQIKAFERLERKEVRSYEATHVGGLGHLDFHNSSLSVVDAKGNWHVPDCYAMLDDYSRVCFHAQWYLVENTENLVHGFEQACLKRGLVAALMSDRGGAMMSEEFQNGLRDLGILHEPTLSYSPYQNGKQERFWSTLEGELMRMLEHAENLTLAQLNEYTQAWVEMGYNNTFHEEIRCTPNERFRDGPIVLRPSVERETLRMAFSARATRKQRKTDGTISIDGIRFEIPGRLRILDNITVRYRSWDLSRATVVDARTGKELAQIRPLDKHKNANGMRRIFEVPFLAPFPTDIKDHERIAPLLKKMMKEYSATGLPPAFIPKDEKTLASTDE